jgi:hypothetical protein
VHMVFANKHTRSASGLPCAWSFAFFNKMNTPF